MSMNYFTQADLVQIEATYNYTARAGMGFGITPENEQVFIAARDVDQLKLNVGDTLKVWATDNFASPHTVHYPSRWRAVRVELVERITDLASVPTNAPYREQRPAPRAPTATAHPTPHASDFSGVMDLLMETKKPWTVNELTHAIANMSKPLSGIPDLIQKVAGRLHTQHKNGDVACLKVFARGEQQSASAVYYAKDVDVFYDHLDTPLGDEE